MHVVLFGGSGTLGAELKKTAPGITVPSRKEVDITDFEQVEQYLAEVNPDVVINAAAVTDNRAVEKMPVQAIRTNIGGSANLAIVCYQLGCRYVYISTDYVYEGTRGNYRETDCLMPFNLYSWTKLGGECSAVAVKNHLIVRTSFGKNEFVYPDAFIDKWTSKDYVDVIAPLIYEAALSPLVGVLNLGTERKTLYDHALQRNNLVNGVRIEDTNFNTPYDTSLNLQKWLNYKSGTPVARPHTECRICGGKNLVKYLDLGLMPLANNLEFTAKRAIEKERYPLQVLLCGDCFLSQLSVVIDPGKMFSYYTYRSGINQGYVNHCKVMAEDLKEKLGLSESSFMIDIAGNDGTLLREFKKVIDLNVLNVDPATNLVAVAESMGIESLADFWSLEVAKQINASYGGADLITATNVIAHVDDIKGFMEGVKYVLKKEGVLVLEFPYLVDFIEGMAFDTIYFEHLSYLSVLPLMGLCNQYDMKIIDVENQDIHGGTIRVTIAHQDSIRVPEKNVEMFVDNEYNFCYNCPDKYNQWAVSVKKVISEFSMEILKLKKQGYKLYGFGASAKGNTLLNCSGMNTDIINCIIDDTPEKIMKFSPGTGIPIVHRKILIKDPPDYLVILSWNFAKEIIEKCRPIYSGKYIIPIPKFTILE